MNRFICYLYEYRQGQRTRNVGFVKVEQNGMAGTIHIHGKGLRMAGGESFRLYLLIPGGGETVGVPYGEIGYAGPAVNYRFPYEQADIGGVFLESTGGRKFAAVWMREPVDVEHIRLSEENENAPEDMDRQEEAALPEDMDRQEEAVLPEGMTRQEEPAQPEDISQEEETAQPERILPESDMEVQEKKWKVTKIKRQEISMLPRCEWRLANNNFLLHGYYNYRHLVLIDDGEILKLGVPGIYHEREARAAAGLGFPEFMDAKELELSLSPQECDEEERFGYWCRQVRYPPV